MTVHKARELIQLQPRFGGGYKRHAAAAIPGEIQCRQGRQAADGLIRERGLEQAFGLVPGSDFSGAGRPS